MDQLLDVLKGLLATLVLGSAEQTVTGEVSVTWHVFFLLALLHTAWVGLRPPRRRRRW